MAVKTTVKTFTDAQEFPCLRRSKATGMVVLFSGVREGMVVHRGDCHGSDPVGTYATLWHDADSDHWEGVKSVTIEEV